MTKGRTTKLLLASYGLCRIRERRDGVWGGGICLNEFKKEEPKPRGFAFVFFNKEK